MTAMKNPFLPAAVSFALVVAPGALSAQEPAVTPRITGPISDGTPPPAPPERVEPDYIVGNPPFVGASRMRDFLGDGYTEAVRKAWKGDVPESADFVMFWWQRAAELLRAGKIRRFGFITTNSIHQTFNRRVLEPHLDAPKKPLHLAFAIPNHPWVDSADGAAVRIAMTVGAPGKGEGELASVVTETEIEEGEHEVELIRKSGHISANLRLGADVSSTIPLLANSDLSNHGIIRGGEGFLVSKGKAIELGFERIEGVEKHLRPIINGKDLNQRHRGLYVIDLYGLTELDVQTKFPEIYQHLTINVKPTRRQSKRKTRRENWWLFNESVPKLRRMLSGISQYISTSETAKHRVFVVQDHSVLPEHKLINIALDDAYYLGVLSSSIHVAWALAAGSRLEDRPVYVKTTCFEPFPFPAPNPAARERIRELGERLDAHRKRRQELHPDLTLTAMYNVLEALRSGEPLSEKEREIHDDGLVSVLREIHDALDDAVFRAYGWDDLTDAALREEAKNPCSSVSIRGSSPEAAEAELLERLVALNRERADEERRGLIRWLRPDFQNPEAVGSGNSVGETGGTPALLEQAGFALPACGGKKSADRGRSALPRWPAELPARFAAVRQLLAETGALRDASVLSARFGRKSVKREKQIAEILQTMEAMGAG